VESLEDHFEPSAPDTAWLPFVGSRGWIAVTHDQLRSDPEEQMALMVHGVKTFVMIGRAPHRALAELFVRKVKRIKRLIESHDGPFLAKLYAETGEVKVAMTLDDWLARQGRRRR
jgi:PIN like domain